MDIEETAELSAFRKSVVEWVQANLIRIGVKVAENAHYSCFPDGGSLNSQQFDLSHPGTDAQNNSAWPGVAALPVSEFSYLDREREGN